MSNKGNVREPQAELLSAEEALRDVARLREKLRRSKPERVVAIHVPLSALLEALDFLEPMELQQVAQRAQERLGVSGGT